MMGLPLDGIACPVQKARFTPTGRISMGTPSFVRAAVGRIARIAGRGRGLRIARAGVRIPLSVGVVARSRA